MLQLVDFRFRISPRRVRPGRGFVDVHSPVLVDFNDGRLRSTKDDILHARRNVYLQNTIQRFFVKICA
jgi:hypothetical protein